MSQTVLVVGATGTLGARITEHLLENGDADVRLLVREFQPDNAAKAALLDGFTSRGATTVVGDLSKPSSLDAAVEGVDVVVSAVQGARDIIVDGQVALAEAAARAGVRRFIPSDFALDIWSAPDGAPMFALRREADARIEQFDLDVLHVLNGAFMDMLLDPNTAGVVDLENGTGNFYGSGTDPFDVTLIDDVAAFTARLATDESATSGIYPITGERTSFEAIITEVEALSGRTLERNHRGDIPSLEKAVAEAPHPWAAIGEWYNLSMITTPPFERTENERYPDASPTSLRDYLRQALPSPSQSNE